MANRDDCNTHLTPLTSKLKEFSLNIPKDSNWADDAEENPGTKEKSVTEEERGSTYRVPMSAVRIPSSRKRSRRVLPTPTLDDSLDIVEQKLYDIALAVQSGENAALITDLNIGVPEIRDPTEHAKQSMKLLEREQFEAWQTSQKIIVNLNDFKNLNINGNNGNANGNATEDPTTLPPRNQFSLPEINWGTDTHPIPTGKHSLRKFTQRASTLATAYSLQDSTICTPEHAAHFTHHHPGYLPLLRALNKVAQARRGLTGDRETLSSMDLAEVQVMKLFNSIASRKVEEAYKEMRDVVARIARSQRVLRERENEIKSGVEGYRPKDYGGVVGTYMK